MQKWFEMPCQWLESEAGAELFTRSELHTKMIELGVNLRYTLARDSVGAMQRVCLLHRN